MTRIYSSHHLDDTSVYHDHHGHDSSSTQDTDESEDGIEDEKTAGQEGEAAVNGDLEKGQQLQKTKSSKSTRDPNLVTWDGPDDPDNPKNWTTKKKWLATIVVSTFTFISPVSSSMVAPALGAISAEFGITQEIESAMVLSIFVLAYAIGPIFLGPLSEIYGRVPVLQLSNLVYLIFNTACGFAQSSTQMIIFRFLAGLGGSAPLAIGGGVLGDAWKADERGRAISIYSLMPLLGPAIGPIAGGFITEHTTWRWAFYATSIADALIQLSGLFFLRETYAPAILHKRAARLRKESGNAALHTEFEHPERSLANTLKRALVRPAKLLGTQPIVQFLAVYMAYLYGLMYLVLSTFPSLFTGPASVYHESVSTGGLNYISLGLGFFLGTQICAPLNDAIYKRLRARNGGAGRPEYRIPLMVPGSLLVPAGLFIYGWTAQRGTHWIGPNVGAAVFAAGVIVCFQCIQTYLVDSYAFYAASAVSAATVLRSLAGFGFPLFASYMYRALGLGWGNSLLGFVAIAIGCPAPVLLWVFGKRLRERSPFASGE
jgi:multidrug resistance protein